MRNPELFDLVQKVQFGDREAMRKIIDAYYPLIRKTSRTLSSLSAKDFEQATIEKIVRSVQNYDLNALPDLETFLCSSVKIKTGVIDLTRFLN
ncbi:hypothetical protein D3C76_214770 [compost metagenome]